MSVPANTVAPAISGTASPGSTLTCSTGTWTGTPAPTFGYHWYFSSTQVHDFDFDLGDTDNAYTVVGDDVGGYLSCSVTATNVDGSSSTFSNFAGPVAAGAPPSGSVLLLGVW